MGSKKEFKMLSFSTTLREIRRMPDFLVAISDWLDKDGDISTKDKKLELVKLIISKGAVSSNKIDQDLKDKINIGETLNDGEIFRFMDQAKQAPKWEGRLSNYFNKTEPLGLVIRNSNDRAIKTKLFKYFLDFPDLATQWALINIPANNPRKYNLNNFTPLGVISRYLKKTGKKRISFKKLALLMSLENHEEVENIDWEKDITNLLNEKSKMSKDTLKAYNDEWMRTLTFSGLFKHVFDGVEATDYLISNVDKIINQSSKAIKDWTVINTPEEMIDYINNQDYDLITEVETKAVKSDIIKNMAKNFSIDQIKENINKIIRRELLNIDGLSNDVKPFVVIEWLVSLLYAKDEENTVIPNLIMDHNGFPISHAPGNKVDIEIYKNGEGTGIEVTLIENKKQQINNETVNLVRHIKNNKNLNKLIFIAPRVHEDTKEIIDFTAQKYNISFESKIFSEL